MSEGEITTGPKLWTVLARAYRSMAEVMEASVAEEGMCLSDFAVMEVLLHKGSLPISTIGEKVLLTNASMTSAVDRLEQRGLVRRINSDADRRVRLVDLTGCGRKLITDVFGRHAVEIERMMGGLDAAERDGMRSGLKTIGMAAKAMHEERMAERRAKSRRDRLAG
jgi:MarR family 2-MHQ and catechol resistance regulon transcriptional repressor